MSPKLATGRQGIPKNAQAVLGSVALVVFFAQARIKSMFQFSKLFHSNVSGKMISHKAGEKSVWRMKPPLGQNPAPPASWVRDGFPAEAQFRLAPQFRQASPCLHRSGTKPNYHVETLIRTRSVCSNRVEYRSGSPSLFLPTGVLGSACYLAF